jgi:hypothetical protein
MRDVSIYLFLPLKKLKREEEEEGVLPTHEGNLNTYLVYFSLGTN